MLLNMTVNNYKFKIRIMKCTASVMGFVVRRHKMHQKFYSMYFINKRL